MLRVFGSLTIVMVLVGGCSQQPPNSDESRIAPSERSAKGPAEQQGSGDNDAPDAEDNASTERGKGTGEMGGAKTEPGPKLESPNTSDPETHATVFKLLSEMGSDAAEERRPASDSLDKLGEAGISFVVLGLREGTKRQKVGAATYLIGRVSPRDSDAAAALIEALSADDEQLRHSALHAVGKLSKEQLIAALPALVTYAENQAEAQAYRSLAIRAVTKLGQQGEPAAKNLIELARDGDSMDVRRACYFAVAKIASGKVAEEFYQTELKTEESADLRSLAAKWLSGVTSSDRSLESLVGAFNDPNPSVRLEAVDSLVKIGRPALPLLIKALGSPSVQTRRHAALAVGKLGLLAEQAVPALKARLNDPDQQVRELVSAALKVLQ